jgi:hypothetical protein
MYSIDLALHSVTLKYLKGLSSEMLQRCKDLYIVKQYGSFII